MLKLLKISTTALIALGVGTAFAADDMYLRLKEKPSKEEVKKFCGYWEPLVRERRLEVVFADKDDSRKDYEHHCRKGEGKEGASDDREHGGEADRK